MSDMIERACEAYCGGPWRIVETHVRNKMRAALLAALDPEDEALMRLVTAASNSGGSREDEARAIILAIQSHAAQGGTSP